ncbi:DapH/DapD/GlmU-related protein [Citrobacter freundii]
MFTYWFLSIKKKVSPVSASVFFNSSQASRKKKNRILVKAGIKTNGSFTVRPPFFFEKGNIQIGNNSYINSGCVILDHEQVVIGESTFIGPHVTLTTVAHPISPKERCDRLLMHPIHIGKNVWIGAGTVILPGVNIGDGSVVAANSVVNCDVLPNTLYAGSPAVFKKNLE